MTEHVRGGHVSSDAPTGVDQFPQVPAGPAQGAIEQSKRDAAVAVILEELAPGKVRYMGIGAGSPAVLAPHIADALARAGLLSNCQPTATNDQAGSSDPAEDVVKTVAAGIKAGLGSDHVMGNLVPECYEDFARAAIAAMPGPELTADQVAYIKAATLQEEANWWEQVRPTTVGRTQFGTWLRGRADVHLRAAGITVEDGEQP